MRKSVLVQRVHLLPQFTSALEQSASSCKHTVPCDPSVCQHTTSNSQCLLKRSTVAYMRGHGMYPRRQVAASVPPWLSHKVHRWQAQSAAAIQGRPPTAAQHAPSGHFKQTALSHPQHDISSTSRRARRSFIPQPATAHQRHGVQPLQHTRQPLAVEELSDVSDAPEGREGLLQHDARRPPAGQRDST